MTTTKEDMIRLYLNETNTAIVDKDTPITIQNSDANKTIISIGDIETVRYITIDPLDLLAWTLYRNYNKLRSDKDTLNPVLIPQTNKGIPRINEHLISLTDSMRERYSPKEVNDRDVFIETNTFSTLYQILVRRHNEAQHGGLAEDCVVYSSKLGVCLIIAEYTHYSSKKCDSAGHPLINTALFRLTPIDYKG